jgi:hypothetical protein
VDQEYIATIVEKFNIFTYYRISKFIEKYTDFTPVFVAATNAIKIYGSSDICKIEESINLALDKHVPRCNESIVLAYSTAKSFQPTKQYVNKASNVEAIRSYPISAMGIANQMGK